MAVRLLRELGLRIDDVQDQLPNNGRVGQFFTNADGEKTRGRRPPSAPGVLSSCRDDLTESIPYPLAINVEVGGDGGIQVYDQVRARVWTPRVRADIQ